MTIIDNFSTEDIENEIWFPVNDFPNYEVSNLGRVRFIRVIKHSIAYNGYARFALAYPEKTSQSATKSAHNLVAGAFIGRCPEGHQINHIDGNKLNNRPENLEYVTPSQNVRHAIDTGLITFKKGVSNNPNWKGEAVNTAKATVEIVKKIRQESKAGANNRTLREKYGMSKAQISKIINYQNWKHVE